MYLLKRSTFNCQVKCDAVEKRQSYRLFFTWLTTDFSALKMFKLKCYLIFKNRLPHYCQWRHSDAVIFSFINYHKIIVLLKQSSTAHRIHLPAGRRTITHSTQRTELAVGQLSRFHYKGPMAFKFAEYKPSGLSHVGCNVGGLSEV